jgi:outer membrane protein assembly factor BamB
MDYHWSRRGSRPTGPFAGRAAPHRPLPDENTGRPKRRGQTCDALISTNLWRYYNGVMLRCTTICCGLGRRAPMLPASRHHPALLVMVVLAFLCAASSGAVASGSRPLTPALVAAGFDLKTVWTAQLGAPAAFAPARDGSTLFVPLATGRLAAVSLRDGSFLWEVDAELTAGPAACEGLVMVAETSGIRAFSAAEGVERWRIPADASISMIHADGGWLFVSTETGSLEALRAEDGSTIWAVDVGAPASAAPAAVDDRLYLPLDDGRIVALDLATGGKVWQRKLGGQPAGILAAPDRLFVSCRDNMLYSLSMRGGLGWRWRTGGDIVGPAIADDARVYFASLDNVLRALHLRNGSQQWKQVLPIRPRSSPTFLGELVLVSGFAPEVRAYRRTDGAAAGTFPVPDDVVGPVQVVPEAGLGQAAVVVLTVAGELVGLGVTIEPPLAPLQVLPGEQVPADPVLRSFVTRQPARALSASLP